MDDQEDIRKIAERIKILEDSEKKEGKSIEQEKKEHLERLEVLHRRARGEKW